MQVILTDDVFKQPYNNAIATARTCYSAKGIVTAEETAAKPELRDSISQSIFEAGHHTTIQHSHFQFAISGVSRLAVWELLHNHTYYNSEQTSQRYCAVKPGNTYIPYGCEDIVNFQMDYYLKLCQDLMPVVAQEYYRIFPARAGKDKYAINIKKKAQEVARYVLPLATHTYLYHTVSLLTLARYHAVRKNHSLETQLLIERMVSLVLAHDPDLKRFFTVEVEPEKVLGNTRLYQDWCKDFDIKLGGLTSRLVSYDSLDVLQEALDSLYGYGHGLTIDSLLNPALNPDLGLNLNTNDFSRRTRLLKLVEYKFAKKISHAADSQDQRHRETPGIKSYLYITDTPDYITPQLITIDPEIHKQYGQFMQDLWGKLSKYDNSVRQYLAPNALAVRFYQKGALDSLLHKYKMRLCYNAQEEIWAASKDEVSQIIKVHPEVGKYLLPPCGVRKLSGTKPFCPEGARYCGVPVWNKQVQDMARVI